MNPESRFAGDASLRYAPLVVIALHGHRHEPCFRPGRPNRHVTVPVLGMYATYSGGGVNVPGVAALANSGARIFGHERIQAFLLGSVNQ